MKLDDARLDRYRADGFLWLPAVFSPAEVAALREERDRILTLRREEHLRAEDGEFLGTTAMERVSPLYDRLRRDERLLGVARQLIGEPLYCHQYKIILKQPFGRLSLPWHQDYAPWQHHDGMAEPNALSLGLYLDEVTEFNGPILYIPGSQAKGPLAYEVRPVEGTTPIPSLPERTVQSLVATGGIVAPKGPAGSVVVFDCLMAHASGPNLSPAPRSLVYVSYNRTDNAIREPTRPDHFATRDFTPLADLPRAALLEAAA